MEESHPQPERRSEARYAVDTETSLVFVNQGGSVRARMFEVSLDGCRVRADRHFAVAAKAGVEITFKINGIAFRLAGTMQWLDAAQTAGIQFGPMVPRRREALEDLLNELEAEKQAEENVRNQADAAGTLAKPAEEQNSPIREAGPKSGVLAIAVGLKRNENQSVEAPPGPGWGPHPSPKIKPSIPDSRSNSSVAFAGKPAEGCKSRSRPSGRERREQARHAVDTRATVFFIDTRAQISGRINDLSMSGCRIRTDERFPVGIFRRVETEFNLDGLPFRLAGVVQALHDKFTVGIRFLDLSARKKEQLAQLMEEIDEMKRREAENTDLPLGSEASGVPARAAPAESRDRV